MTLGALVGRSQFYRGRAAPWMEMLRGWVLPIAGASAAGKYLGLQSRWAVGLAILVAIAAEVGGVLLGWWLGRTGAVRADFQAALDLDPYRSESLTLLREIRDRQDRLIRAARKGRNLCRMGLLSPETGKKLRTLTGT